MPLGRWRRLGSRSVLLLALLALAITESRGELSLFPSRDPGELCAEIDGLGDGAPLIELRQWRPYGLASVTVSSARLSRALGPVRLTARLEKQDWSVASAQRLGCALTGDGGETLRWGLDLQQESLAGGEARREGSLLLSGGRSLVLSLRARLWEDAQPGLRAGGRGLLGLSYRTGPWSLRLFRELGAELETGEGVALTWRRGALSGSLLAGASPWQGLSLAFRRGRWELEFASRLHAALGMSHGASFRVR
jgi:hypothetical protein